MHHNDKAHQRTHIHRVGTVLRTRHGERLCLQKANAMQGRPRKSNLRVDQSRLSAIRHRTKRHLWHLSGAYANGQKVKQHAQMEQKKYGLGFISDEDIYNHVRDTVLEYKATIDLKKFNANVVDPIKLTFDAKIYNKPFEEIIDAECNRQIDKSNTNQIGYFHQNLFKYVGGDWIVPDKGFDIVNDTKKIYVEMKNKHNTMNSTSSMATYLKMQDKIIGDPGATCMLVEVIAKRSQNIEWKVTSGKNTYKRKEIRRVSIDKFYEIVFGDKNAFLKLCRALPLILEDVVSELHKDIINNTVLDELKKTSSDTFKSLYMLAFKTYEGFDNF